MSSFLSFGNPGLKPESEISCGPSIPIGGWMIVMATLILDAAALNSDVVLHPN